MRWIASDGFLGTAKEVRTVWLSGIFGTGKTATAVAIAAWLLKHGWAEKFISNIPVNGQDEPEVPMRNCIVLLDEAHLFLPDWKSVKAYSSFLRKVNMRLLMPSVYPPHSKLRILEIQRTYNGYRMGGMLTPFWYYNWRINAGMFSQKGYALLWKPHDLFGVYDTDVIMPEDNDEKILYAVEETIRQKANAGLPPNAIQISTDRDKRAERRSRARQVAKSYSGQPITDFSEITDAANTISDAVANFRDASETLGNKLRR